MNIRGILSVSLLSAMLSVATTLVMAQDRARDLTAESSNIHVGGNNSLAIAGSGMPATVANFLSAKGHDAATIASLVVSGEHTNPNLGTTHLRMIQEVGGLTVYGTYVKAAFDSDGNLIHLIENLAGSAGRVVPAAAGARDALDAALAEVHPGLSVSLGESGRSGNTVSFGGDAFFYRDPTVTRVAVAMANGALHEGYLVETWTEDDNLLHHTLVGGNGHVLGVQLRTNNDSYNVFTDNPEVTPQAAVSGPGAGVTESPIGWLSLLDGGGAQIDPPQTQTTVNITGNNAHAYLDTTRSNSPDPGGSSVTDGIFGATANLFQEPETTENKEVAVQNLFYLNNVIHDMLYAHGFVEAVGNFQEYNFGNGGSGSDSVRAEAQDGSGTNNANFSTPSDGSNPRMQMFVWTQSSPKRDGDVDSDIVYHEYGHGLTWRMIGNMSGSMSGAIGEGMGDVLAILINNNDIVAEYSYNNPIGIRSRPYAGYTRTYGDMGGNSVHFDGEIYAATIWHLWELAQLDGLSKDTLFDYLIGGMDSTPAGPAFEDMRDGILAAAKDSGHECLIWTAFAAFGIGDGASGRIQGGGPFGGGKVRITESFNIPADCAGPVAPVANDDSYSVTTDAPLTVNEPGVLANDSDGNGDAITAVLVSGPSHGSLGLNSDGSFTYTQTDGQSDSFTYKVVDATGLESNPATVTINVTAGGFDANAMYIASIQMGKKGPNLDAKVTIKRDADADGLVSGGDLPVAGAVLTVSLCNVSECSFDGTTFTTDSAGTTKFKWLHADSGLYTFTVFTIDHATYTYELNALDALNPETFDF